MTALVLVAGASLFTASAASKKKVKKAATLVELKSSADSLSYVAGMNATRGLIPYIQQSFQVDTAYMENFLRGYKDALAVLPSGLQYKVITEGHGEVPKASDEVEVIYEGRLIDGTVFDATSKHGGSKTDKFRANGLIKGWTEALTLMPVGSKWQVYIPYELAYGERQAGQIPPYSTLVFDLELVSIVKPEVKAEPAGELKEDVAVGAEKKVVKPAAKKAAHSKRRK